MIKYVEFKCRFENGDFPSRIVELTLPITAIHRLQIENNKYYALIHGTQKDKRIWTTLNKKDFYHVKEALLSTNNTVNVDGIAADQVQSQTYKSSIEQLDVT